jgi:hypothetical protein
MCYTTIWKGLWTMNLLWKQKPTRMNTHQVEWDFGGLQTFEPSCMCSGCIRVKIYLNISSKSFIWKNNVDLNALKMMVNKFFLGFDLENDLVNKRTPFCIYLHNQSTKVDSSVVWGFLHTFHMKICTHKIHLGVKLLCSCILTN